MGAIYVEGICYSAGGGGGSGHTILDNGGYALTQRSKMQFNGTYSEDNSTDGITEVNVIRSMTKAEFDQLSESEKQGIINITDITSGSDDRFQPVIYSTDEREIGVWTDGKPLYEKTFISTTILPYSSDVVLTLNDSIPTGINVIELEGSARCTASGGSPIYISENGYWVSLYYNEINNNILGHQMFTSAGISSSTSVITLRYTKTADAAGSGQWTPQGVPAIHYSEEEQVVGTWIDGSTLYEKTIYKSSITLAMSSVTAVEDLTSLNIDTFVGCEMVKFIVDGNINVTDGLMGIRYNSTTKKLNAQQKYSDRNITGELSITIRYTKSSS